MFMHQSKPSLPGPLFDYPVLDRAIAAAGTAYAAIARRWKRWRCRRSLAALDDRQLADIGVSRDDIANWSGRLRDIHQPRRRTLADLDASRLSDLSEAGVRAWHAARREHSRD